MILVRLKLEICLPPPSSKKCYHIIPYKYLRLLCQLKIIIKRLEGNLQHVLYDL